MATDAEVIAKYKTLYRMKKKMEQGHMLFASETRAVMNVMQSERFTPTSDETFTMLSTIMEVKDTIETQHECPKEVAERVIGYRMEDVREKNKHIDWSQIEKDFDDEAEFKEMVSKITPRELRELTADARRATLHYRRLEQAKSLEELKVRCGVKKAPK